MKKEISEQEAWLRLSTRCAASEHCQQDMLDKLRQWGVPEDAQARIMERLVSERYVDDERFARAYVNDKVKFDKWGRRKVEQGLWQKRIDDDIRRRVLDEVDEQLYVDNLRALLKQKQKSVKAATDYERSRKLVHFALSRGYDFSIISQSMDVSDMEEE